MNTQSCNLISVQPNAVSCLLSYPSSYHFAGPAWWIIIARKSYTNTDTKLGHSTFEMLDPADTKTYNIASRPDDGDTGCVVSSLSKDAQSMTLEVRNVRVIVTWTRHALAKELLEAAGSKAE